MSKINQGFDFTKYVTPISMILILLIILIAKLANIATLDALMTVMYFMSIALSLNIIMGFAGYVSFGHAVFLGIGGYFYVLLIYFIDPLNTLQKMGYGVGSLIVAVLAGLAAALVAATVGAAVLRLRGAFFAIATIGLDFTVLYLIKAIVPELNPEQFFGAQVILPASRIVDKEIVFNAFFLTTALLIAVNYYIRKSPFGFGLTAIKEDEDAAEILGVPTTVFKVISFSLAAFFTGMVGGLWALNGGGVDESLFGLNHSIDMIVMIVIGGLGTVIGPVIGSLIYYELYDLLLVHYPGVNLIILGIIVAIMVLFFPEGLIGILRKYRVRGIRLRDILE